MGEEPAYESHPPSYPPPANGPEAYQDVQALRTLGVFTYIWAGICAVGACAGAASALVGSFVIGLTPQVFSGGGPIDEDLSMGTPMINAGFVILLVLGALAILHLIAARSFTRNRNRSLILVSAVFALLNFPFGTVLGVFTFIVMTRPGVKSMFASSP